MMLQQTDPDDYVIATGNTWTIHEFIEIAFKYIGITNPLEYGYIKQNPKFMRPAEVPNLFGDPRYANRKLGWKAKTSFEDLVNMMMEADMERYDK
jgi:GDPmannose 4,6-dehydratase